MTTLLPAPAFSTDTPAGRQGLSGWRELGNLALLYAAYAVSRVFADDSMAPARERAFHILILEDTMLLDVERAIVEWFVDHDAAGLLAAYYYASAHYVVTAVVLMALFLGRKGAYPRARQTLVASTLVALVGYLLMPTAPPRLVGFPDLMALHAARGWWGEAASAPQGMGWMTNQLAAFPSMHAGWALWVALAVTAATASRVLRAAGWAHAVITVVVVVGTGNHWLLDVVAGWAVVFVVWRLLARTTGEQREISPTRA
ncbi:phosphatase PAP2 family protein [Nocardioides sp.]|uniref:phosphatase PAP2 family protein n=1 Tax=Nocardioides sp. TaxID=35761 RepID=UPI002C89E90E|nr:phosphatase PAP2 family protein [Nocardioides sp.]HXH80398.1 phosphatase PAP2 family protein [Nocardioides sp.]